MTSSLKLSLILASKESTADFTAMMQNIPIVIPNKDKKVLNLLESIESIACLAASLTTFKKTITSKICRFYAGYKSRTLFMGTKDNLDKDARS